MPVMPRKAKPVDKEVPESIDRISAFMNSNNFNVNQLSKAAGVSQSALARFQNGERKTVTSTARRVLGYVNNRHKRHDVGGGDRMLPSSPAVSLTSLERAIRSNWELSAHAVSLLAAMIAAAAPILESGRAGDPGQK